MKFATALTAAVIILNAVGCTPTRHLVQVYPICRRPPVAVAEPVTRVILLPSPNGKPSAVEVTSGGQTTVLSHAYDAAEITPAKEVERDQFDTQTVQQRYERLLSAQPPAPNRFTLYFQTGTSDLTPASSAELDRVLWLATNRPGGEIVITGHTDRVGSMEANDALSLRRARAVRQLVIKRGFDPIFVYAIGRGERELAVSTANQVSEPRNRRVEIVVR